MRAHCIGKAISIIIALIISVLTPSEVIAYNNPGLLPDHQTPIIDLANILSDVQEKKLQESLDEYEEITGWKIRVLTQFESTPGLAVKDFWALDERSLLLIADPRGGNLLNFNVGDAYFSLMPRLFWVELQTRYGNQYYVKDNGEDGSILGAINSVETCLNRGGCQVVPGLPKEQWLWTLITSILGGIIAGSAGYPRKEGEIISWGWLLLFSPLWIMLFGIFGVAPVITRTSELLPLVRNGLGFIAGLLSAYLIAQLSLKENSEHEI